MMTNYYSEKLSAKKLRRVYEVVPPRVRQYLDAELDFTLGKIQPSDTVLELGCGYGRVLDHLAEKAAITVGVDTSLGSLRIVRSVQIGELVCLPAMMDASQLGLRDDCFDVVVCIQNGISAFNVDRLQLLREAIRVTRRGGIVLLSTYAEEFWNDRLRWFELQAAEGLLGEIDYDRTGDGNIVCKDGFTASTVGPGEFRQLAEKLGVRAAFTTVDHSSLFCEITVA
ncbi:MAG: class I SAM-dependent methyltransferase [candidate division Zixibacteria bacterium]|nr:class I SAM-dependent methyltransferase [candidate division Zixibacteria bacterium]